LLNVIEWQTLDLPLWVGKHKDQLKGARQGLSPGMTAIRKPSSSAKLNF